MRGMNFKMGKINEYFVLPTSREVALCMSGKSKTKLYPMNGNLYKKETVNFFPGDKVTWEYKDPDKITPIIKKGIVKRIVRSSHYVYVDTYELDLYYERKRIKHKNKIYSMKHTELRKQ